MRRAFGFVLKFGMKVVIIFLIEVLNISYSHFKNKDNILCITLDYLHKFSFYFLHLINIIMYLYIDINS